MWKVSKRELHITFLFKTFNLKSSPVVTVYYVYTLFTFLCVKALHCTNVVLTRVFSGSCR